MEQNKLQKRVEDEAERIDRVESEKDEVKAKEQNAIDGFDGESLKLIPTPNFTDAPSVGTMLPINMANEIVTNVSQIAKDIDLVEFIREKLGYTTRVAVARAFASEQIDALVLAIKSFEKRNAFILGDMAGIGKGRVCAGVLRYAYQRGIIPIFLTQKPFLFSDIYRDIIDIEGFGIDAKGKMIEPKPFVLHQDGVIRKRDNTILRTAQAIKETISKENPDYIHYKYNDKTPYGIQELCRVFNEKIEKDNKNKKEISLGNDFNCVFLPYSVLSMGKKVIKKNFLKGIAPNSILVFDESHTAASGKEDSNILKMAIPLVEASKAVLFSSATYAKSAQVYNLYIIKTALRTAVPSLENITDALKIGGENVSEYIASGLAKEGQMIRRERSFGDCKKVTNYVGMIRSENALGEIKYTPIPNDKQIDFYDEAISYFKELRDFSKSSLATNAVMLAIERKANELRKNLANTNAYLEAKKGTRETRQMLQNRFIQENMGKWLLSDFSIDSISRYKATFRENLFLAIKAKYTADKIIESLNTPVDYTNIDGTTHTAPLKPLIAIKSTGEQIFNELQLQDGQRIKNDFSVYLKAIYNKLFIGTFYLRKVDANIFVSKSSLIDEDDWNDNNEIKSEYNVEMADFSDNGTYVTELQSRLDAYNSELPFSIIDYLRDRINSTNRSDIYYIDKKEGTPRYGSASSPKYVMEEATSRNKMLKRIGNTDMWEFVKNDRIPSVTEIFRAFNNGGIDVMLINVVASTGGSAQSSPKEGSDTRPRNMFTIQFEADINIEVQKRGRINRTGQINSPTYTYVISRIPVELRTYLMFRKKLRKLDANTSANQSASSQTSEIPDMKGKAIQDIFNQYGFEVFQKDFIDLPMNFEYKEIFDNLGFKANAGRLQGDAEKTEANLQNFDIFVKELELYPSDFQRVFFDQMNVAYTEEIEKKKLNNEYQLELEAKDYKAKLKQRVVIQLNNGDTVFSYPLFKADYYSLENFVAWSKAKVQAKGNELAEGFKSPAEFYKVLINDYEVEYRKTFNLLLAAYDQRIPQADLYATDEEYNTAMDNFQRKKNAYKEELKNNGNKMLDYMRFFKPMSPVFYNGNLGYFVGYKIKDTGTKFKYSDGSIDFIFCFLNKFPVMHLKKSSDEFSEDEARPSLDGIKKQTTNLLTEEGRIRVAEWKPNLYVRIIRRFLTGNILQGIVEANKLRNDGEIKNWALTRFYLVDGSINTAVELKMENELPLNTEIDTQRQELKVASSNENMVSYLKDMELSVQLENYSDINPVWNAEGDNVIERAMCFIRYEINGIPSIYVNVFQQYKTKDKQMQPPEKQWKKGESRYNDIFYDLELNTKYKDYLIRENFRKEGITYAKIEWREWDDKKGEPAKRSKYGEFNVFMNTFAFNPNTNEEVLKDFLKDLYIKYEIYFNFRSSAALYNTAGEADVELQELQKQGRGTSKKIENFVKGAYQYRFTKNVGETIIQSIPYFIQKTTDGLYGGVLLEYPLSPLQLPSYSLKPYRLPNEVYVKLTLGSFSDEDKTLFVNQLEEKAQTEDARDIGLFVSEFISRRTISAEYFFGDLRASDYGLIFKEYGLKKEIKNLLIEEKDEKVAKTKKNKVTFEDAETFLMYLL